MQQVLILAALALKVFTLYFVLVFALGFLRRRTEPARRAPKTRFAVVVAARNEGAVIGGLVRSLRQQDYPAALFDVYVVPNNCTDDTAARAAAAGACVFFPRGQVASKGEALDQAFAHLLREDYAAFLVFDADNIVDRCFLSRCNDAFCAGAQVVKGRHLAQDPGGHWLAACYDIYFRAFDLCFNRPRAALGLSCKLVGTGFGFRREVLLAQGGWRTETIAEDAEFSARCAASGTRVCWVPAALTYDQQPRTFAQSLVQRRRWCSGVMQVTGRALPALVRGGADSAPFRRDMACFLLTPWAQPIAFLLSVAALLCARPAPVQLLALPLGAACSFLALALAACLVLLLDGGCRPGMWRGVVMFPFFMASFLPLQVLSLFSRTRRWRPIAHTAHSPAVAAD